MLWMQSLQMRLLGSRTKNADVGIINQSVLDVEPDKVEENARGFGRLNPLIRCWPIISHNVAPDKRKVLQQVQVDPGPAGPEPPPRSDDGMTARC